MPQQIPDVHLFALNSTGSMFSARIVPHGFKTIIAGINNALDIKLLEWLEMYICYDVHV
jgi:hypothetical protein